LKKKNLHPKKYQIGDIADIPDNIAKRWIDRGIARSIKDTNAYMPGIKVLKFHRDKKPHVHIRDIRDGWIMAKFGDMLRDLADNDIRFTIGRNQDKTADINYYINWTNGRPRLYKFPKSKCDIILFTHFEKYWPCYREEEQIIKWADYFTCMSAKGKKELIERGIPKSKIAIMKGIGTSINFRRKIKIGWAGRPNYTTKRKGNDDFLRLSEELDSNMFKFLLCGKTPELLKLSNDMKMAGADVELIRDNYKSFITQLDYYLSPSRIEGGPMDMLNAYYAGIPIVSRKIGFFCDLKTRDDYSFTDYKSLLKIFKKIEKAKKLKFKKIEPYNWDNFGQWHIKYFRKILAL